MTSFSRTSVAITVCLISLLTAPSAIAADAPHEIPLANPGFEDVGPEGLPANWEKRAIGVPARVSIDENEKHSGRRSARMDADEMARSNVVSEPFPVAPGETIHASAWVKCKDVPADQGKVMMVGEWTDAAGLHEQASRIEIADVAKPEWQRIEGKIAVPAGAARMRLRLGFVYSHGTIWWDDVTAHAERPLVARVGLSGPRLSPLDGAVPVTIVNRAGRTDRVRVRVALGGGKGAGDGNKARGADAAGNGAQLTDVVLTGEPEQHVNVPLTLAKRGKQLPLKVSLLPADGESPLFTDERKVNVPPPVVIVPLMPTHWAVEDGPPKMDGEVELAVTREQLAGATLDAKLVDGAGNLFATWTTAAERPPNDFVNAFSLAADAPLPAGDYWVVATLRPADGKLIQADQPFAVIPRQLARVTLNADGYPVYDGAAIFPLGIFNGGAKVKEMGEAGFTVQHAYNAVNVELGERPNDQGAKDFLDNAGKNGMKGLFLIPRGTTFGGDWSVLRRRVRMFKNHPALLAWDEEEGIARGDMPPAHLAKLRQIVSEEDPHHPLMVGDSRDVIARMTDRSNFFPVDHMDLGMWWWYPFPLDQGRDAGLEGEERSAERELRPPSFLTLAKTDKPLWVGVQAYKKPQPWGRYPTPTEYRAQAYLAIIHGAKGLMWYGGSVTGGMYARPDEAQWPDLKALARELRDLSPVFLSPTEPTPRIDPPDAQVSVMLKRAPDRLVLLAVNRSPKAADVTITLPAAAVTAKVLPTGRTAPVEAGRLRDRFEPYAAHVYEVSAR